MLFKIIIIVGQGARKLNIVFKGFRPRKSDNQKTKIKIKTKRKKEKISRALTKWRELVTLFVSQRPEKKRAPMAAGWVSKGGIDWRSLFVHTHQVQHTHTQL